MDSQRASRVEDKHVYFRIQGLSAIRKLRLMNDCTLENVFAAFSLKDFPPSAQGKGAITGMTFSWGAVELDPQLTPNDYKMATGESNAMTIVASPVYGDDATPSKTPEPIATSAAAAAAAATATTKAAADRSNEVKELERLAQEREALRREEERRREQQLLLQREQELLLQHREQQLALQQREQQLVMEKEKLAAELAFERQKREAEERQRQVVEMEVVKLKAAAEVSTGTEGISSTQQQKPVHAASVVHGRSLSPIRSGAVALHGNSMHNPGSSEFATVAAENLKLSEENELLRNQLLALSKANKDISNCLVDDTEIVAKARSLVRAASISPSRSQQDTIDELLTEVRYLKEENRMLIAKLDFTTQEVSRLRNSNTTTESALAKARALVIARQESELDVDRMKQSIGDSLVEQKKLNEALRQARVQCTQFSNDKIHLVNEIESLRLQLKHAEQVARDATQLAKVKEEQTVLLKKELREAERHVSNLEQQLSDSHSSNGSLERQLLELRSQLHSCKLNSKKLADEATKKERLAIEGEIANLMKDHDEVMDKWADRLRSARQLSSSTGATITSTSRHVASLSPSKKSQFSAYHHLERSGLR